MLVVCDASQLEWRTAIELSQDPIGIKEIVEGLDTHSLNQEAFQLPSRLIAKIYLFRTIFRGSGYAFANDPAFMHVSDSPKFWDSIGEKFYAKYNVLDATHKRWADSVVRGEPLMGVTGRQWDITLGRTPRGELKLPWTILTNYPVQGTGADVMMVARISFSRRLKTLGIPALLISTVHDSIVVDCERIHVQSVVNLFYQVFDDLVENIRRTFKYDWKVPLACECKTGMTMMDRINPFTKEVQCENGMVKVDRTDKV